MTDPSAAYVTPSEIVRQRALGWSDFHPEDHCHRCGGRNPSWHVDSDRFNTAFPSDPHVIVCPGCFVAAHEKATGLSASWTLVPATPFRPVEEVDRG
jgi:hypothetical protein